MHPLGNFFQGDVLILRIFQVFLDLLNDLILLFRMDMGHSKTRIPVTGIGCRRDHLQAGAELFDRERCWQIIVDLQLQGFPGPIKVRAASGNNDRDSAYAPDLFA